LDGQPPPRAIHWRDISDWRGLGISSRRSAARPLAARAQQPGKLPVMGFLNFTSAAGCIRAFTRSPLSQNNVNHILPYRRHT